VSVAALPKAELHVHLEGTASPELVRRLAVRHGVELPAGLLHAEGHFDWTDFLHFLATYDLAASVVRTAQDYRDVTFEYLSSCAGEGAVYVELIASPDHAAGAGLSDEEHFAGIAQGIQDATAAHGIEARILATALRNRGPEAAEDVARRAVAAAGPWVVGFNLSGDEAGFPPEPFARAYAIAADGGLGCTAHAGEWAGPASVRGALALPGVTRISHGVRAVEDPALVAELAERGTVLEVCPGSNVALGVYPSIEEHPLPELLAAGVRVTLGSDDPPYFETSIGQEYAMASDRMGLDDGTLVTMTRTALDAAFADAGLRERLSRRLPPQ
jgi:adenosine deaminase